MIGLLLLASMGGQVDLDLEWAGPAACPEQREIELRVADLVGRPVTMGPSAAWSARAEVVRRGAGFVCALDLTTREGTESRALRAPTCDALADAVAVILALALDSQAPEPPPIKTSTRTAARTSTPTPARARVVRPRRRATPPARSTPIALAAELEVSGHLGLPGSASGLAGALVLRGGPFELGVGLVGRASERVDVLPDLHVQAQQWAGVLRGCARTTQKIWWGGCLSSEVGRVRAEASGRAEGALEQAYWWWAHLEITGGFELVPGLDAYARLQASGALWRRPMAVELVDDAVMTVYLPPRFSLGFAFGFRANLFSVTD